MLFKMATARIRNNDWQEDEGLKEALTRYVRENLRRNEVLDFVSRDFSDYAWSLRTLDRRLQYFGITYTDRTVQVDEVEEAVKQEMQGPGKLLGYRALHKKLRQVHDLNVPRDLVYAVMYNVDPDALAERAPQYKKKKAKGNFISRAPLREYFCAFPETSALSRWTTIVSRSFKDVPESFFVIFLQRFSFILFLNLFQSDMLVSVVPSDHTSLTGQRVVGAK